jgi:hypothetical protein
MPAGGITAMPASLLPTNLHDLPPAILAAVHQHRLSASSKGHLTTATVFKGMPL